MKLSEAYVQCESIIKHHSKTFHKAFSLLPKKQRNAVWAIYAFCRTVDDVVDESAHPMKDLALFEEEFTRFLQGDFNAEDPKWVALSDVFNEFDINVPAFQEMIDGQKMDINERKYETIDDLLDYSYHVASTVGLMLLPVLAPKTQDQLKEGAVHLGYAMQITNILRDVGEDLLRNRVYLPSEVMNKHGYTMDQLAAHENNEAFRAIWEELAGLAELYYEKSLETIHLYPLYSRPPVKGAAYLYRAILKEIRANDYEVFKSRNFVSSEKKEEIISTTIS